MRIFGFVLMGLLGGATLFIISNTIRLTVFARRKEIAIMKYVGATDWFIRWPFLLEGIVLGCIGGFIAAVALRSFYAAMAAKIYSTLAFLPADAAVSVHELRDARNPLGGHCHRRDRFGHLAQALPARVRKGACDI